MNSPLTKKQLRFSVFFCTVLGITVLVCILSLLSMQKKQAEASIVSIYQDGRLLQTISLSSVQAAYQIRIDSANGGYNLLEVRPGSIGVLEASCPDRVCINMGFCSHSSLPIACLPNRLVLVFSDEPEADTGFDITAY